MPSFSVEGKYFVIVRKDSTFELEDEIIIRHNDTGWIYMTNDNYPGDIWTLIIKYGKHEPRTFFLKRWFYIIRHRVRGLLASLV